jgi:PAS domain S-box-containing protein
MPQEPAIEVEKPANYFASIVDASPDCIRILGLDGRVEFMNARGQALLEIVAFDRNKGHYWPDLWPAETRSIVAAAIDKALAGETNSFVAQCPTARGVEKWWATTVTPVRDEGGRLVRLLATSRDITEYRASRAALSDAVAHAEAASRAKSEFLANMSHEIRTPFNAILGMLQVMQSDHLSPAQRDQLDVARRSAGALLSTLDDILDLSRIEAGMLDIRPADFSLGKLLSDAVDVFRPVARQRGLELRTAVDPAAGDQFWGDPVRIRQIVHCLLSNALKFCEHGWIELRAAFDGEIAAVSVADTGVGIPPHLVGSIFERFVQGDGSATRRHGGLGLGLAVARELAELMGGALTVDSAPGRGAVFTLSLPLKPRSAAEADAAEPATVQDVDAALRVLAAEDNHANQLVLRSMLQIAGVEPVIVDNGRSAVEAWEGEAWDLILMDVQMPEMDGCTATRRIRAREKRTGRPRTPIVGVTANTLEHQLAEYKAAGMDDVVPKPVEITRLFAALERVLAEEPVPASPANARHRRAH